LMVWGLAIKVKGGEKNWGEQSRIAIIRQRH